MSVAEPGHPLFLTEDSDDDPVAVSEIQIARVENGQQVFYPRLFPANELQSLEQVAAELGGGSYILIARHEGRITTRRKYVLPGKPKPMYDEGRQEPVKETAAPTIDPMMAMMGGSGGGMMPFFMMMMQQQDKAADRQMQMMIAMMQGGRESSSEDRANARAEMQANIERERIAADKQMAMMREMMMLMGSSKGGGSEDFTKGVEFMRSFATQQVEMAKAAASGGEGSELSSLLDTLGQAFQAAQAVGMFKGVSSPLPEGVAQAAEVVQ